MPRGVNDRCLDNYGSGWDRLARAPWGHPLRRGFQCARARLSPFDLCVIRNVSLEQIQVAEYNLWS